MAPAAHLSYVTKYSYGVGHVFNDLCASMWFTYLLVFFEKVLLFTPTNAGLILLVGQLADGVSTPFVGIFSDKENKIAGCARYGRRKVWHLMGTIFVAVSFPFIFSKCIGCSNASESFQMVYFCLFVILFQFGWASVQISHLALIPELTAKKHIRTELNSIRYAFTVLSNLSVYAIAFLLLEQSSDSSNGNNAFNVTGASTTTMAVDGDNTYVTPDDATEFRNLSFFCVGVGLFFSVVFHFGVKEPPFENCKNKKIIVDANNKEVTFQRMRKMDWFKEVSFYQVAVLYMATRLFVNLYQVYIPMYVQDTLHLNKSAIATVPFVMYLAGFVGSLVMKAINKHIGRKGTYALGTIIGIISCATVGFVGMSDAYLTWGVYIVAAMLGIAGSTVLITSLSITADLIGSNVEGGAFVYGFMSFTDKVSNGVVVMIIQSFCDMSPMFYKRVITYACGSACLLGLITTLTLIPVKIGRRRGAGKSLAASINDDDEEGKEIILKSSAYTNGSVKPIMISGSNPLTVFEDNSNKMPDFGSDNLIEKL